MYELFGLLVLEGFDKTAGAFTPNWQQVTIL